MDSFSIPFLSSSLPCQLSWALGHSSDILPFAKLLQSFYCCTSFIHIMNYVCSYVHLYFETNRASRGKKQKKERKNKKVFSICKMCKSAAEINLIYRAHFSNSTDDICRALFLPLENLYNSTNNRNSFLFSNIVYIYNLCLPHPLFSKSDFSEYS